MTPRRAAIRLDLIDGVVFSERAASTGAHRSLDHIPGAALLGAMAARLYAKLEQDAFLAFHSGSLRFGNGLPLHSSGRPSWPMPFSLHRGKGEDAVVEPGKLADGVENRVLCDDETDHEEETAGQWEDLRRHGYITAQLDVVQPARAYVMRTAINGNTGRARDQQLFGYQALPEGQSFLAIIEADAAAEPALDAVLTSLLDSPTLRLGRSRGTEYGQVRVTILDESKFDPPAARHQDKLLRLWALSDLCLTDAFGRPSLTPTCAELGLTAGDIDPCRTFIRVRRYAPFNAHWRRRAPERFVIRQGSVITLRGADLDLEAARQAVAAGVGHFREAGLGRIAVNPWILSDGPPEPEIGATAPMPQEADRPAPQKSIFIRWLERRQQGAEAGKDRADLVRDTLEELEGKYDAAERWTGIAKCGPGPAQWNAVRDAAEREPNAARLERYLFDSHGIARDDDDIWSTRYGFDEAADDKKAQATFHGWLRRLFDDLRQRDEGLARTLPEFAKAAAELARRRMEQAVSGTLS